MQNFVTFLQYKVNFQALVKLRKYSLRTQKIKKNTSLAAPGALANRLQHLPANFIQKGRCGPEIGQTLGYLTLRSTFAK